MQVCGEIQNAVLPVVHHDDPHSTNWSDDKLSTVGGGIDMLTLLQYGVACNRYHHVKNNN